MDFCGLVANSGKFAKLLYRNGCIYKIKNPENRVFLTFDDGPTPGVTDWVLDILDKYSAKATFFMLGKNAEQHSELLEMVVARGHSIGNHTYNHLKGINVSTEEYLRDIERANQILRTHLFRPPYGRVWPKQVKAVKQMGYKVILWTVISCDYNRQVPGQKVYNIVKNRIRPGSIIVFHDSKKAEKNMKYALVKLLEDFADKYVFDKIVL